jgi:uroporphyrinogen decarboxylase
VLRAQAEAGATALQLFDSWVGVLSPDDYAANVLPYSQRVFVALADLGVPRIHFGVGTSELLHLLRDAGADVVGVDWRIPLDRAWERMGSSVAIQGNLDPAALLAPWPVIERKTRQVLAGAAGRPGHIFNLGHGVLPETSPDTLRRLTEFVHEETSRK